MKHLNVRNWTLNVQGRVVELCSTSDNQRNFWVSCWIARGELVWNNPRNVRMPRYAMDLALALAVIAENEENERESKLDRNRELAWYEQDDFDGECVENDLV